MLLKRRRRGTSVPVLSFIPSRLHKVKLPHCLHEILWTRHVCLTSSRKFAYKHPTTNTAQYSTIQSECERKSGHAYQKDSRPRRQVAKSASCRISTASCSQTAFVLQSDDYCGRDRLRHVLTNLFALLTFFLFVQKRHLAHSRCLESTTARRVRSQDRSR